VTWLGEFSSTYWSTVTFVVNYRSNPTFWATSFHGKSCASVLTKNGSGFTLGDFFTNSSGHSDGKKSNTMKNDLRLRNQIKRKTAKNIVLCLPYVKLEV
jgi:hypothetical protein